MSIMKFSDDILTGMKDLDDQHKEFFVILNEFFDSCKQQVAKEKVEQTLLKLEQYSINHFSYEEQIMFVNNYKKLASHRIEHSYFLEIFQSLKESFETQGATTNVIVKTNKLLINWLISHIRKCDKEFVAFMKNK